MAEESTCRVASAAEPQDPHAFPGLNSQTEETSTLAWQTHAAESADERYTENRKMARDVCH